MAAHEERKARARNEFKDWLSGRATTWDKVSKVQRSKLLCRFFVETFYNRIYAPPIDEEAFDAGLVDGRDDQEVDLIHRDDGRVVIVQSVCLQDGGHISANDVERFQSALLRLKAGQFGTNARLAEIVRDSIDFEQDQFELHFVGLGRAAEAKAQADLALPLPEDLRSRCDFNFWDETRLNEELRQLPAKRESNESKKATLYAAGKRSERSCIIELQVGGYRSCVLVVDAGQIRDLYQKRPTLFHYNIRNYLGSTPTNRALRSTLEEEPEHFFFYNNGISCLARRVSIDRVKGCVEAEDLSVINGAQTVRSLTKNCRTEDGEKVRVVVRITEVLQGYGDAGRFRDAVVRYNNTQNVIKISDFRSNDPIHEKLAEAFRRCHRNGDKVEYHARRSEAARGKNAVRMEEFAKVVYSFLEDPIRFSGSTSYLFDLERPGYAVVFGNGQSMDQAELHLRLAIWWVGKALDYRLKVERSNPPSRRFDSYAEADRAEKVDDFRHALERRWMVLFAAKLALIRAYGGSKWKDELARLHPGDWEMGDGPKGMWCESVYEIARDGVVFMYAQAKKRPGFNHRQWMRSEETVESLKSYFAEAPNISIRRMA